MRALIEVVLLALSFYRWIVIVVAVMSWLMAFNVINIHNDLVRSIWTSLNALTEPVLRPIRRFLPAMGGIDIAPVILLFIIFFLERVIEYNIAPALLSL